MTKKPPAPDYFGGPPIDLPPAPPTAPAPTAAAVAQAVARGQDMGFVARDGGAGSAPVARKPGRKRTEPRSTLTVHGPTRVVERFRAYCAARNLTSWEALERLLDEAPEASS